MALSIRFDLGATMTAALRTPADGWVKAVVIARSTDLEG